MNSLQKSDVPFHFTQLYNHVPGSNNFDEDMEMVVEEI